MMVVLKVDCRGSKGHGKRAYIESGVKLVSAQTFQADESVWGGGRTHSLVFVPKNFYVESVKVHLQWVYFHSLQADALYGAGVLWRAFILGAFIAAKSGLWFI